jgi:two-component system CheB/CheR fusion protein
MAETPQDIEHRYRLLVEHVTDYAIFMLGTGGRVSSWNEGAQRILGFTEDEIVGQPCAVTFTPEDRDSGVPEQELATAARDGRATDERWHLRKDGSRFYASGVMTAVRDETGTLIGFAKLMRDRTDRKLAEDRLVTEHAVSRVLAEAATLAEAVHAVLEAVCRTSGWQCGSLWAVDAERDVLRCVQGWCDPTLNTSEFDEAGRTTTFGPGVGLPGRVWAGGTAAWVSDVSADDNFPRRQAAVRAGLHAALAFPVAAGGRVLGVIEFFSRDVRPPDGRLLDMMLVIGRQVGQSVARRRAEEGLRASEARNAAVLDTALDCVVSMDHEGRVTEWNPAAERTFGFSRAEAVGREMADLTIPPQHRDAHRAGLATYLATGEGPVIGRRIEITALRKGGAEFPVELAITRVPLPGPPVFTGHLRDITDRKESERDLADARRELARKVEERTRELAEANTATRLEREFLAAVLESAEDGIVACDADGTLRLFNRATREFHGLPESPLPPERWADHYDLYLPDGRTRMSTEQVPLFRALRDGAVRDAEMVIAPKGGTPRHLTASGRAILDADGRRIGAVVVMHDLTDRRLAEGRRVDEARRMSEFRFQRLVEHSPLSTQLFWPDGRTRQVNAAFTRLFGITLAELRDYNILRDPQLVATGIMPLMARAFAGEAVVIDPIPYVPDRGEHVGQTRWAGAHVYPVKDDAGRVEEVVLVHHDVTEQRRAEQALRESEERLRLGLDAGNTGTWDWDIVNNRVTWSDRVYEFHGVEPGGFSGRVEDFSKLVHPDDAERVGAAIRDAVANRTPYVIEFRVVHPDGGVHWIATNGKVYYADDGRPLRMLGATTDATDRKRGEEERERLLASERAARAEAERANEAKNEFIAVLSHELRTPLTPVLLTASLMESHPGLPDDLRADVATIKRNVELESRLISDLLDLTRIAQGKLKMESEVVDAHLLVRSAIDICQREDSVRLAVDLLATGHHVLGDGTRLQQVWWNLVNNAIRHGGRGVGVTVRTSDGPGGRLRVEVTDDGDGIDPAVLPKLFTAFEQGEARSKRQFAGLGLGLAICRKLVEAHGGTITATSDGRGKGATFTVELPTVAPASAERGRRWPGGGGGRPGRPGRRSARCGCCWWRTTRRRCT